MQADQQRSSTGGRRPLLPEPRVAETGLFEDFGRRTIETFLALAVSSLAAGIYAIIVARLLGPSGIGVVSVLLLLSAVGALLVADPLGLANIYFGVQPSLRPALLTNSLLVALGGGAAVAGVGYACFVAADVTFGATETQLALAVATVPFVAGAKVVVSLVLASGRSRAYNVLNVLGQFVLPVVTAGVFLLSYESVTGVITAYLITACSTFAATLVVARTRPGAVSTRLLRQSFGYGIRGSVGNALQFLNYRLDFFLVSALKGSAAVGVYSVAVSLAELLWRISAAAATILFPRVAAGSPGGVAFTARVTRIALAVTAAAALALAAVGYPLIVGLFGSAFAQAYVPMLLLLPGVIALSLANILASDLAGRGNPGYSSIAAGVTLVVTIALDLALIPRFVASGAAVASTAAYSAAGIFLLVVFTRRFGLRATELVLPRLIDLHDVLRQVRRRAAPSN
jgi:stage V sporulation protein B